MVLRPHILRYRGKFKKVDSDKMKKIFTQQKQMESDINQSKAVPKMNAFVILGGIFVFAIPFIYYKYLTSSSGSYYEESKKSQNLDEKEEGELLLAENRVQIVLQNQQQDQEDQNNLPIRGEWILSQSSDENEEYEDADLKNDIQLYQDLVKEHDIFLKQFKNESDTFKIALISSIQSALVLLPKNILEMEIGEFANQCDKNQEFEKTYNLKFQYVHNTTLNVLSSIGNLLHSCQQQKSMQLNNQSQNQIQIVQEQPVISQKKILEDQEIQCKMSQEQQKVMSQLSFGVDNQNDEEMSINEEDNEEESVKGFPQQNIENSSNKRLGKDEQESVGQKEKNQKDKSNAKTSNPKKKQKKTTKRGKTQPKKTQKKQSKQNSKTNKDRKSQSVEQLKKNQSNDEEKLELESNEDEQHLRQQKVIKKAPTSKPMKEQQNKKETLKQCKTQKQKNQGKKTNKQEPEEIESVDEESENEKENEKSQPKKVQGKQKETSQARKKEEKVEDEKPKAINKRSARSRKRY